MQNAPAVSYPVGRSRLQGGLIALATLGAASAGIIWHEKANPGAWREALLMGSLAGAAVVAARAWHLTPQGRLVWDGQSWSWLGADTSGSGALAIHFDLQSCMLLSLPARAGQRIWLWPQRSADPAQWSALRRAVFSGRVSSQALQASFGPGPDRRSEGKS